MKTILLALLVTVSCSANASARLKPGATFRDLVELKAALMSADYRGDLAQLDALRTRASQWTDDPQLGYLADYWRGYASWRMAINGGMNMPMEETRAHMERAVIDFESSLRKKNDFADAYAAAAGSHGWLAAMKREQPEEMKREIETYQTLIKKALELEPRNPRVLWIQATPYIVLPREKGGNPERAIELYHDMIRNAAPLDAASPLPDWGKVEGLMLLAYAHTNVVPDLDAAAKEAREALRLQPDWKYLRDTLMPQIETRLQQR